jgi:hypothetical protein
LEDSESSTGLIPWPSIILESLNYNFEDIEKSISNFTISTSESDSFFDQLLKIVNENSNGTGKVGSHAEIKKSSSQKNSEEN